MHVSSPPPTNCCYCSITTPNTNPLHSLLLSISPLPSNTTTAMPPHHCPALPTNTTAISLSMETNVEEPMENPPPLPSLHKTYELSAINISYSKPPSTPFFLPLKSPSKSSTTTATPILHNVSLTARPSELLAIVGPSGAGKSTLLDILSTRIYPTSGLLLLNSLPFPHEPFRRLSHHLPQSDLPFHHPLLTVLETFLFASHLLPSPLPISTLLHDLRLSHLSHLPLSGPLSGGERRRVSLGLSLLPRPPILLLDEPTSGLDSSSALHALLTLRRLSRRLRTTVILSIHQPGSLSLDAIDSFLLLHRGRSLHHGPLPSLHPLLLSLHLPPVPLHLNPLEHAMEIADDLLASLPSPPSTITPHTSKQTDPFDNLHYGTSRIREISELSLRFLRIIYRTKQLLLTNSLEALGVGFVLGTIYMHVGFDTQGMEKRLGLFAFTLTFLLSSTTESLPIFINERPIVIREVSGGLYRLSSHLIANTLIFLPYLFFMAFLYSISVYFLVGLCATWGSFAYFVLVTWVVVLMANSFVLFLSSLAPNYIAGTSLVTMSLAAFFLFSGYFLTKDTMPKPWVFMHYLSLYRYALDAMVVNEYWCSRRKCFEWEGEQGEGRTCSLMGIDVLQKKKLKEGQRWTNVQVMLGYFVLYRLLYWAVLARRISMRKK